jgi:flagellar basal-body rod protein FlgG
MRVSTEYLTRLQGRLDIIANNLANANIPAFKEGLLFIEENYDLREKSNTVAQYGGVMPEVANAPIINSNMYVGRRIDFSQGALSSTGNPLDMAISGEGFFQIRTSDGQTAYTRAGLFSLDSRGNLVNNEGMLVEPQINIPSNATQISIESDGTIRGVLLEETEESQEDEINKIVDFGQIPLFLFSNPDGLEQLGHNLYLPTEASGEALGGTAGREGYGEIKSGMLERSNTDLVKAMTQLIEAQRAYQFDLRIIKDRDEMRQQAIMMRG